MVYVPDIAIDDNPKWLLWMFPDSQWIREINDHYTLLLNNDIYPVIICHYMSFILYTL